MRRRILYVHHGSGTGGAPLSLCYLIRELDVGAYEPIACCHPAEQSARDLFERFGLTPRTWPLLRYLHSAAEWWKPYSPRDVFRLATRLRAFPSSRSALRSLLAETNPDIVHLNSATLMPYAGTIKQSGARVVVHVREPVSRGTFGVRRAWLRRIARKHVDAIIYICRDNRDRLTGTDPIGRVIYNFVDFGEFDFQADQTTAREELALPANVPVVLFSGGSASGIKGIVPLTHALARLRDRFPNLRCLMPGTITNAPARVSRLRSLLRGKPTNQRVDEVIARLGLEGVIHRSPFTLDMPRYYAACDVVAVPFTKPHFARAVVEAGAMAKPVVASRIGGVEEVVQHERTGLLVPPNDPAALADALARVLGNSELADRLGTDGLSQARELFDAKRNAAQTVAVYEELQ